MAGVHQFVSRSPPGVLIKVDEGDRRILPEGDLDHRPADTSGSARHEDMDASEPAVHLSSSPVSRPLIRLGPGSAGGCRQPIRYATGGLAYRHTQVQASATMSSRVGFAGAQPSLAVISLLEATRIAGSPGRRGASTVGMGRPVTSRAVSMT